MLPFVEDLSVEKLHVQAPTEIVFVCGGPWSSERGTLSMRDAFLKVSEHPALGKRDIVIAEDLTKLSVFSAHYDNLLDFETDLAQITELILLFCESAGSYSELGSFASTPEIAERLLVIIRDFFWKDESFIRLGPLMYLIKNHGEASVFVIEDNVIGVNNGSVSAIDLDHFKESMSEPLKARLADAREPSTFDGTRAGHIIKLIVGLIQEYGALEFDELNEILPRFGVNKPDKQLRAYLLCAISVGWVEEKKKGFRTFIVAREGAMAAHFVLPEEAKIKNRRRRRLLVRQHWAETDKPRFRAIQETLGEVESE